MKLLLLTTAVFLALVHVGDAAGKCNCGPKKTVPTNCDSLCFCPCLSPDGGGIVPSQECLKQIRCEFFTSQCSAEVMACKKQSALCFCPCRMPGFSPDNWCYPSQACLKQIRCDFGKDECTPETFNTCVI